MIQMACAVFIGGGIGSVARWLLSAKFNSASLAIPMGTMIANLTGAFIIGLAFALFTRVTHLDPMWKMLITTGFCGGLTTFSTFSYEVILLMQEGRLAWAGLNVAINLAGSFLMTAFAIWLVNTATVQ
ncbi:fluoride efflux transporter CrcB [uncultured Cedecea sp.]|uniref:fluoride efflux transporter CrcB n=1 Tax=uncultured Cedecea sp. TaxID=988762 RepID=UPI00261C01C7|nr:fluoride efflux transporter CrcB [uncultured Cedecea sp.]